MKPELILAEARIWALAALASIGLAGLSAAASLAPPDPARVAAVFPPWWSQQRAFAASVAAGDVAGFGAAPFVMIVTATETAPGLERRLRAAGAIFFLDPDGAFACAAPDRSK